ncbi:hypothetical protein KI387_001518, partial [Taxus chinensis]
MNSISKLVALQLAIEKFGPSLEDVEACIRVLNEGLLQFRTKKEVVAKTDGKMLNYMFDKMFQSIGSKYLNFLTTGVLEANFIEPAHDKQGFERTTVMARLESRLISMQRNYWSKNCHIIGYAPRNKQKSGKGDSVLLTQETNVTETSKLSTGDVESIPLVKNPVPAVTQVENVVDESEQSDHDTVQAERQSNSSHILPEVTQLPHEEAQHQDCAGLSPQRLSNSLQSSKHIVGQQNPPQRHLDLPELHDRESQQLDEVHSISSELPEQLQRTEKSQNLQNGFLRSRKHIVGQKKNSPEQCGRENRKIPEVHSIPSEHLEQLQVIEQAQDLQKRSLRSRNNILEQQNSSQRHFDSPELHARENQQAHKVHSIPSELPEQSQLTEQSPNLQKRSSQSTKHIAGQQKYPQRCSNFTELHDGGNKQLHVAHSIPLEHLDHCAVSSLSTPSSRPPTEVDLDQLNRELDFMVTTTQISQVSTRTAADGLESGSTTANAIELTELGSGPNLQNQIVNHTFDSNSIHENNPNNWSCHLADKNRHKQLEEENEKLKERIKTLEETMLHGLQMEIEKNINLQAHIEELEKNLEASKRSLSDEQVQRYLEENELQNKLK